jgi:MFS family permease
VSRPTPSPLRRTLRGSILEGGVSEVWTAFATGAVLTAWALFLGAGASTVALLQGLATGAQVLHGPAGFVTEAVGRKRLAIVALTGARLVWAPLAMLPLLGLDPQSATILLVCTAGASAVCQVLGQNAWNAWMGDVVPKRLRGRFFGARTALVTAGAGTASLGCALLLESAIDRAVALPMLAALVCISGVVTAILLARQMDPRGERRRPSLGIYLEALRDSNTRGLLYYQLAWGASVAPGAAFFSLYVLDTLHASFFVLAAHAIVIAIVRMFTAPLWGRAVDRWGARPVLVVCSLGIASMPLLWMATTSDRMWPLAIDAVLSGCVWGGHSCASFDLPLGIAPVRKRSYYLALFAMASGIGFAISAAMSGVAAEVVAFSGYGDVRALFLISAVGRAACALLAAKVHEPDAIGVRAMLVRIQAVVLSVARVP